MQQFESRHERSVKVLDKERNAVDRVYRYPIMAARQHRCIAVIPPNAGRLDSGEGSRG